MLYVTACVGADSVEVVEAVALRDQACSGAAIEAVTHMLDVCSDGSRRDPEGPCDLASIETVGQEPKHLDFAWRQWLVVVAGLVWHRAKGGDDLVAHRLAAQIEATAAQANRARHDRHLPTQPLTHAIFCTREMFGTGYLTHQGPARAFAR